MTTPLNNLTDTWNNGSTVFTGLKYNITNTASAAASLLFDFQIGGVSKVSLDKLGTFASYNINDGLGNYERGVLDWTTTSNVLTIGAQALGTGTLRNVAIVSGTTLTINAATVNLSYGAPSIVFNSAGSPGAMRYGYNFGNAFELDKSIYVPKLSAGASGWIGFGSSNDPGNLDTYFTRASAGVFQFANANSFSANSTTATVLGSLGPSGAHTTVQKWLTIVDSGGATLYIPCF